jgi:hypothetical protein
MPWADRQSDFAVALLDSTRSVPPGLVDPDGHPSAKRFAVYRNNVVVGLIDVLQASFPATCRIVGDEFFRAMARGYVVSQPPISPILLDYGAGFASFIARFEPAASLPYLADVARIERAWIEAYHAPEASALQPQEFAAIPSEFIAETRFSLHPSLRVVRSRFPALTIWRMNINDGAPTPVDTDSGGEDALILRPDAEVVVRSLPGGAAEFIAALVEGRRLVQATKSASAADRHFDLSVNLTALIGAGAITGCRYGSDPQHAVFPA